MPNTETRKQQKLLSLSAIGAVGAELVPHLGCLHAAIILHKTLLHGIFGAPLQFFDSTPSGRILSRFSKDIDVVDNTIPQDLIDILYCTMEVIVQFNFINALNEMQNV